MLLMCVKIFSKHFCPLNIMSLKHHGFTLGVLCWQDESLCHASTSSDLQTTCSVILAHLQ